MMRFDSDSLTQRKLSLLNEDPDWKPMVNNSVVSSLVRHDAEVDSEIVRYGEYLFNESRIDTAQNRSSVVSMANLLGYQPKRKISAHGKLYVSLDSKITYVPNTITMDSLMMLKDHSTRDNSPLYKQWNTHNSNIIIDPSCTVLDSNGTSYVIVSPTVLPARECFVSIDIIQGVRKTKFIDINTIRQIYSRSLMNRYIYIPVRIKDCEAATTVSSRALLNVYVETQTESGKKLESYRVVDNLLLSSDGDKDIEFYNDLYNQDLFYLKFRDDPYHGGTLDLSSSSNILGIRIDYVESLGKASNLNNLYETFYINNAKIEGSSGNTNIRLFGINYSPMEGGADEESITEIKKNATKEYIKYYGVATKENYQRVILNTEFPIDLGSGKAYTIIPRKVQVYGGYEEQGNMRNPVTNISFIGTNLEDNITGKDKNNIVKSINTSLNYCLSRLKSPQDTLRFVAPIYTSFAVGVKCKLNTSGTSNSQNMISEITNYIEDNWGPNSSNLDFGRDFYESYERSKLYEKFSSIRNVDMTVEAVKKLNWDEAVRMNPWGSTIDNVSPSDTSQRVHTCRIPFEFSTVFKGSSKNKEGFRDYNTASSYVMRIDFLYKAPTVISNSSVGLNRTIFFDSGLGLTDNQNQFRTKNKFYRLVEGEGSSSLWPDFPYLISSSSYDELGDADPLPASYIVDFKQKVYDDDDYILLKNDILQGRVATRNSSSRGTIDSYLVYFSGDYTAEIGGDVNIGAGFLEIPFDEIYSVLSEYALYDKDLETALGSCSLNTLKCNTADEEVFKTFKNIVSNYLDIYVSMRPYDSNLVLQSTLLSKESGFNGSNEILYIDSYDSPISDNEKVTNLTSEKRARFISVECSYAPY